MIKIQRCDCPEVLIGAPVDSDRYRTNKVVETLWEMQNRKCAYCEMLIPKEGHIKAVEHFKPKSIFKGLRNDWDNLLLVCSQCNGKKSDKFPIKLTDEEGETKVVYLKAKSEGEPLILDPSYPGPDQDPEDYIDFIVDDSDIELLGLAIPKNDSDRGKITIEVIGLYIEYYKTKRQLLYIEILYPSYLSLLKAKVQEEFESLENIKERFNMRMSAKSEFAAFARAFARSKEAFFNKVGIRIPKGCTE